ncbi:alcohol-forming fatty acyl-CoA reductase-like [Bidens hawaiensis]|uniref:alcohol-forming fatty acyl-CoA reductase-like n=1 Tax=Bidens hawaiensis TaxID=980011 RepID=UPI00404AF2E3
MESIIGYFENKSILVTGATGFLGKIFVEKILRLQPNIKKLYVLIRASDSNSALQRLHSEVIGKDLFRVITQKHGTNIHIFISEKITPVAGDIGLEDFGVTNMELLNEIRSQVDIVVNSAATTNFDERYDVAFTINTLGAKNVSKFVNECSNIKLLLHVSTAYVWGEKSGIILETPFKIGETLNGENNLNIKEEQRKILERHSELVIEKANEKAISSFMKDFGIQRANLHGWPNTYSFTKAMGEMLLLEELREDVPLVVLRPTIITSTYKEPFPGWIEGVKTIDSFIVAYGKGRTSTFLGEPSNVLDLIPADMVINAMLVAIVIRRHEPYSRTVYHVGSSMSNPLKIASIWKYIFGYFATHPLINRQGNPIQTTGKVLMLRSMSSFNRYMSIRYLIPLKVAEYANKILLGAFNAWYFKADREIKIILRLAFLYKPYGLVNMIFDDANLIKLLYIIKEYFKDEMETFFLDTKSIDWECYFMNIHIPGLVKHVLSTRVQK